MELLFLGTGTSSGVPAIACDCAVCQSDNPRNNRRRCSVLIRSGETHLVIDTPPDFRDQALTYDIRRVDAVLITHTHADHIFGMDDLRRYGVIQDAVIPVYAKPRTVEELKRFFYYASDNPSESRALPRIQFLDMPEPLQVADLIIEPIDVPHGPGLCTGFLIQQNEWRIGYFPDCSEMPESIIKKLHGIDVMILDALRKKPSPSHLTLEASVKALKAIGARTSFLTHLSHDLEHVETGAALPPGIHVAYDGLEVRL